jgi:NAD(P)-dependent dehydrogenase (short-subunit alcohol dehydrogenase family)
VVTGGASGIGAATARLLAAEGAHVIVGDLQTDSGSVLAAEIGGEFVHTDVAERAQVEALVAKARRTAASTSCSTTRASAASAKRPTLIPRTGAACSPVDLDAVFYACRVAIR